MSEQRTEKTHPLHGLEPKQPGQQRCVCGAAYFDDVQWVTRYFIGCAGATNSAGEIIVPVAHCPGECGCRLSVVDGEPRVGEKYADLERDAKRFRAVAANVSEPIENREACPIEWHFETMPTQWFDATLGEYADTLLGGKTDAGTGYVLPATEDVLELAGEADTADFWRDVALKAAAATDYDYPMDWDAEQVVAAIVEEVRTARRKTEEAGETLPPDPLPADPVAAVCAITSHDGAVAIPQALMLISKEYGLTTEQSVELLVRAARLRPECVYLERTSASVVGYDSDERGKTITVDGYLRSHARILPSRLTKTKEADDVG